MYNDLLAAGRWFLLITGELVILFLGISYLVGLLQALLPEEKIQAILGRANSFWNYFLGTALGALTPFCSCSTIPIVAGLLRSGIPFGPAMAFLLSSPLLNPVILGMLAALLGLRKTALYLGVTFFGAMAIAALWSRFGLEREVKKVVVRRETAENEEGRPLSPWRRAWFGTWGLFSSMVPYLLVGTIIGAFIYGVVPAAWIVRLAGPRNPFAIPVAAVIGVPMYVRAETLIPISRALLGKGMGIGAVIALLIGGAGASIPEISMLSGLFRPRLVAAFAVSVFLFATAAGFVFQFLAG